MISPSNSAQRGAHTHKPQDILGFTRWNMIFTTNFACLRLILHRITRGILRMVMKPCFWQEFRTEFGTWQKYA